ncbi:MAG: hypothetical protein NTX00_01925 [Candidatus Parcubacteria bacterium]|nr:hypothetical protein [Candidatus Parcubacteria bacterium]
MAQKLISISALIKKGWDLYINNLQIFLVPITISLIPLTIYYLTISLGNSQNTLLVMLLNALIIIVNLWVAIILIIAINSLYKKQAVNLNQIYEIAFKKISSYFWVTILSVLVVFAGLILFIIPGFIFMVWYSFAPFINILEEKNNKGPGALKESKNLVLGRWWPTFWRLLIPALIVYLILIIVITGIFYLITNGNLNLESINQSLMINILISLTSLIITPLLISYSVILYNNLKETKSTPKQNKTLPV